MQVRESVIEKYLDTSCKARGWLCFKTISPSTNGFPDRTIITDTGRVVFCEVKRPNEKPRKLQVIILKRIRDHNADVCVVSTKEQTDILMELLESGRPIAIEDERSFYVTKKGLP